MINKMQNKMISHILKGGVTREENLMLKIKTVQTQKRNNIRSKSKAKINKNEVLEEYKFIATDITLPTDKEESKFNNTLNRKFNNNPENDIIKVTENAFINKSNLYNNIYEDQNLNYRLSQQNELFYKSSRDGNFDGAENYDEMNINNRFKQSSRSELMQKEIRDRSIDINESSNSMRKSFNKSFSRSPKKMALISLTPITEEKTPNKQNNEILRRSSEILMRSSLNKRSLEKRNTFNPYTSKDTKGLLEPGSVRSSKIISFKDITENQESNQSKTKRKSQLKKLNNNDFQGYKTTLNTNNSTKNNRKTSRENTNTLDSNENLKSQQNVKTLKDDLNQGDSKIKFRNQESEKFLNPSSGKPRSSFKKTTTSGTFIKNRSKSEFNISVAKKIIKFSDKEKADDELEYDKNINNNGSSGNNFNRNDLKNLEKIIEINNSNSNINLNLNSSNLNKSEFLREENINDNKQIDLINKENANIKDFNIEETNFDHVKDPNVDYYSNSNKNIGNTVNLFSKSQRISSASGFVAATNNLKNSRILTNSRMNTSNSERKAERKGKKMSLICPESLKTEFIKFEDENRRKSALNSKRNSEAFHFVNDKKSNRYSTVSTSKNQIRSKGNYNNLKNAFDDLAPNNNQNAGIDLNINVDKDTQNDLDHYNLNSNNYRNDLYNNRESKPSGRNSHMNNYYSNLNFNYKNEFESEINDKINNYNPEIIQNRKSAQEFYRGYRNNEDYLEVNPSAQESNKEAMTLSGKFESFKGNMIKNNHLKDKFVNKNSNETTELKTILYNKTREIKPSSTDKFRDLSPIRESEYSQDYNKKRESNLERKVEDITFHNNANKNLATKIDNSNVDKMSRTNFQTNNNEKIQNSKVVDYLNTKRAPFPESNYRVNEALNNFNNLYEFKNNKNPNFIYDEVQEKILPITSFEGESYPENLYKEREEKVYLRENDIINNRMGNNTRRKNEENNPNKNSNFKNNEFNQSASTFRKYTNSNLSNSRIKKNKKSESVFIPWDKLYKEKFREEFKNDLKSVSGATVGKKFRK